jgi:alpha-mannosidase
MITPQNAHREERITLLLPRIEAHIYSQKCPVLVEAWDVVGEPVPVAQAEKAFFSPFVVGQSWGTLWSTTWFRIQGKVPKDWKGKRVVALVRFTSNKHPLIVIEGFTGEGLIYQKGLPGVALNVNRSEVEISAKCKGGESFRFLVEAAANGNMTHDWRMVVPEPGEHLFRLQQAELAVVNEEVWDFYVDYRVAMEAMLELSPQSEMRASLRCALHEAANQWDSAQLKGAKNALKEVLARRNGARPHHMTAVGHAHIDTAWLWPLREAVRKCSRTFSTMLDYLKKRPEFRFSCSQAQHYAWMKAHYPSIYQGIRAAVKRGQWEPIGSMWVEPDCNVPSGESFIRQILHGKRFFQKEFGLETRDCWLPDAFGYSAALPQIFAGCGIDSFISQKLSWNQYNKFPHHTLEWEGIDGTRIFSHFPPADTYNAEINPKTMKYAAENFRHKGERQHSLMPFGWGDGGGGPTLLQLDYAERLKNLEGFPTLKIGTVKEFLENAKAEKAELPVWVGELYLELHRGTFTTQARAKRGNRKSEIALHDAEFLDVAARLLDVPFKEKASRPERAVYDVSVNEKVDQTTHRAALDRAWKLTLLNQFHDILPGSSIGWVYDDVEKDYAVVESITSQIHATVLESIAQQVDTLSLKKPVLVFNTQSFERSEVMGLPGGHFQYLTIPSYGYAVVETSPGKILPPDQPVSITKVKKGFVLENGLILVQINEHGQLTRLLDKQARREVLEEGCRGNVFQLFQDRPSKHDAWDIDIFYREMMEEMQGETVLSVLTEDPWRCVLRVTHRFGNSELEQDIVLSAESRRLDFVNRVDWQERHRLLKVAFPLQVHAPAATGEIQFGHVQRATHANTPWDAAQFEFCAQRWVDLSETGYGAALLNDCKYGYDVSGSTLRLSLLRSPAMPDPEADRGKHQFTYSLFPHVGSWQTGGVLEAAAALNAPLKHYAVPSTGSRSGTLPASMSLFQVEEGTAVLETVKRAEDSEDVILRLYESQGARGRTVLVTPLAFQGAVRTDLLENETTALVMKNGKVTFDLKPFEIITLKLKK